MAWLDSAWRKLARADEHLAVLETAMRRELDREHELIQHTAMTINASGGTTTEVEGLEFASPLILPPEWALLIGDFASNARAALDHLAWQLAGRHTWMAVTKGPPWPPPTLTFPIVLNRPTTTPAKRRHFGPFRPPDRRHVEAQQPFRRGKRGRAEPIWLLNRIRNADIHRELHTVLPSVPPAAMADLFRRVPTAQGGEEFYWPKQVRGAVEEMLEQPRSGDVIRTVVALAATFSPHVTFDLPNEDFHGREVLPLLHECRDEVERILGLFSP
jgi:hypothetical protein